MDFKETNLLYIFLNWINLKQYTDLTTEAQTIGKALLNNLSRLSLELYISLTSLIRNGLWTGRFYCLLEHFYAKNNNHYLCLWTSAYHLVLLLLWSAGMLLEFIWKVSLLWYLLYGGYLMTSFNVVKLPRIVVRWCMFPSDLTCW